jgi:uncharacterized protein
MRVVSLLASTLILATAAFGQQSTAPADSSPQTAPSQSSTTVDSPPEHPCTVAQVRELLELTGAIQLRVQVMRKMMAQIKQAFPPFMPKDVMDDMESSLEKIDIEPMAVRAYQRHVSSEDAAQLIAFYKTPTGQRVIRALPIVTGEMQDAGAKEGERVAQEVVRQHMDEIKAAAAKYQQDHAAPPTITAPN